MNPAPIQPIYKPPIPTTPVISSVPTTSSSTLSNPLDKTMSLINSTTNTISSSIDNLSKNVSDNISQFSNAANVNADASSSYLSSNTLIAKFAFLILVIIVFLFLLNLGIMLIQYFYSPSEDPYLIKGMVSGTDPVTIQQDPNNSDSILIRRSNNESTGLEFTWSVWLHINELEDQKNVYQHIFNKGDTSFSSKGIANINNGPGLYLINNNSSMNVGSAQLRVVMDSNNKSDNNYIDIKEVPIKKWVHVAIRMQNTVMDVYVNGIIAGRLTMTDVPKQNYNNINVNQNYGFNGKLSNLRYYSRALNVFEINNVVSTGPNLETYLPVENTPYYGYLSQLWYSSKV
jgi:hypothetical protein